MAVDYDLAHELGEKLWPEIHDLVDRTLEGVDEATADQVRLHMTETFRFWKRMKK